MNESESYMPNEDGNEEVVNNAEVVETAAPESTPSENNSPAAEEETPSVQSDDGELHQPESEDSDVVEEGEDKPLKGAEKRKEQLTAEIAELEQKAQPKDENAEIRDLVARRNELRATVEQVNNQTYAPAKVDELLEQVNPETGDYYTRAEAKLAVLEQKLELKDYNNQVADAQVAIESDISRIHRDFPMYDPNNKEQFNPEAAQQMGELIADNFVIDPNTNQVVGTKIPLYKLYKANAVALQSSARNAEIKAQKSTERMLASTDPTPGGQGTRKTFAQMTLTEKQAYLRTKGHDV